MFRNDGGHRKRSQRLNQSLLLQIPSTTQPDLNRVHADGTRTSVRRRVELTGRAEIVMRASLSTAGPPFGGSETRWSDASTTSSPPAVRTFQPTEVGVPIEWFRLNRNDAEVKAECPAKKRRWRSGKGFMLLNSDYSSGWSCPAWRPWFSSHPSPLRATLSGLNCILPVYQCFVRVPSVENESFRSRSRMVTGRYRRF